MQRLKAGCKPPSVHWLGRKAPQHKPWLGVCQDDALGASASRYHREDGHTNAVAYYNNKLSELGHVSGFQNTKAIGILSDNKTIMGIAWSPDGSSKVVKWVVP